MCTLFSLSTDHDRGAFSIVLSAQHLTSHKKVAIKVINTTALRENEKERLTREIEVNRMISHPNAVAVYEIYQGEEDCCLVME